MGGKKGKESLAEIMVARSIEELVSRQREQVARDGGALLYVLFFFFWPIEVLGGKEDGGPL